MQNAIQVCDIIIWSTLYPLHKDSNLAAEYLSEFHELNNWMKSFGDRKEVQVIHYTFTHLKSIIIQQDVWNIYRGT